MSGSGLIRVVSLLTFISSTIFVPQMEGQIAITPSSVAYGNVLVGSSQTQTVSITNVGSSNVSVSQGADELRSSWATARFPRSDR